MTGFVIDPILDKDSIRIADLGLCALRLNNDCRWPWLVLVPQRANMVEIFDLSPADQAMLTEETSRVGRALKTVTQATKINVGALGNIVRQLHVHIIARKEGDANWPNAVWGHGTRQPWPDDARNAFIKTITDAM